ncbi:hypothetical protein J2T17_006329 [Paenibacillus mucilaginosus]
MFLVKTGKWTLQTLFYVFSWFLAYMELMRPGYVTNRPGSLFFYYLNKVQKRVFL